ncbi:MAG: alpha/beta hydrolase [Mycobacteriaceae bacterium]
MPKFRDRRTRRIVLTTLAVLVMVALSTAVLITVLVRSGDDEEPCAPLTGEFSHNERDSVYHIYNCGLDASQPVGVLVHLHGDGAGEFAYPDDPDGTLGSLARVANERNMLFVAPQTPSLGNGWTWWIDLPGNVEWLDAFMQDEVLSRQGLDTGNVWWSGYSGGAEMVSYGVLPRLPDLVTGGAVMLAGGGAPEDTPPLADTYPVEKRGRLPLTWAVGELDDGSTSSDNFDALTAARVGSEFYRNQGFSEVSLTISDGHDHVDLPQADLVDAALG